MNAYLNKQNPFFIVRAKAPRTIDVIVLLYIVTAISYVVDIPIAALLILVYSVIVPAKKMVNVLPLILFFYSYLTIPVINLSVFVPFGVIFIIKLLFAYKIQVSVLEILFIFVNTIYCLFVMFPLSPIKAGSGLIGVLFVLSFSKILKEDNDKKSFFYHYGIAAILAMVLSWAWKSQVIDYMEVNGQTSTYFRFLSTFTDPNYAGFFYSIGMWAVILLKPYKSKIVNLAIAFLLGLAVLFTVSVTAIVVVAITCMVYIVLRGNKKIAKAIIVLFVVFTLTFAFLSYASVNDVPYISDLAVRLASKYNAVVAGNMGEVTTNRTNLMEKSIVYFSDYNFFSKLFGGTCSTAIFTDGRIIIHNEYLTLLINIGIIGTLIYVLFCAKKIILDFKNHDTFSIVKKSIVISYGFTLTFFMDFRFLLMFLI